MNLKNIFKKVVKLAKQRSTWVGAATLAAVAGNAALGNKLGDVGNAVGLIFGTAAIATDTTVTE
jgi:hypothetical protein